MEGRGRGPWAEHLLQPISSKSSLGLCFSMYLRDWARSETADISHLTCQLRWVGQSCLGYYVEKISEATHRLNWEKCHGQHMIPSASDGSCGRRVRDLPSELGGISRSFWFCIWWLYDYIHLSHKERFSVAEMHKKDSHVDGDINNELEMELSPSIYLFLSIYLFSPGAYLDNLILMPISFLK